MMIQICTLLDTPFLKTVSASEFSTCGEGRENGGWGKTSPGFSFYWSSKPFVCTFFRQQNLPFLCHAQKVRWATLMVRRWLRGQPHFPSQPALPHSSPAQRGKYSLVVCSSLPDSDLLVFIETQEPPFFRIWNLNSCFVTYKAVS